MTSTADVQKAVLFAAQNQLGVSVRGGGHSYIGASTADGTLVLDMRQLPGGVSYDANTGLATISPAAELDSVQTTLAAQGRSIPSGSCPTVGVAGLTLGGGLGSDARLAGLTCDALVSASVVLPDGERRWKDVEHLAPRLDQRRFGVDELVAVLRAAADVSDLLDRDDRWWSPWDDWTPVR